MKFLKNKISLILFAFLLLFISLSVSCATTKRTTFSEEDASYAMKMAIKNAYTDADKMFYNSILEESFVPEKYSVLIEMKEQIPGMEAILKKWQKSFSDFITENFDVLSAYVGELANEIEFKNSTELVNASSTSGSKAFKECYYNFVYSKVKEITDRADYSFLNKAISQYNSYCYSMEILKKGTYEQLEKTQGESEYFAKYLTDLFFEYLSICEDLFRTTPDPYGDSVVEEVFNIK